jgi:hypothetical protein
VKGWGDADGFTLTKGDTMDRVRAMLGAAAMVVVALVAPGTADVRADLEVVKFFPKSGEGSFTLLYSDFSANLMSGGAHNKSVPFLPLPLPPRRPLDVYPPVDASDPPPRSELPCHRLLADSCLFFNLPELFFLLFSPPCMSRERVVRQGGVWGSGGVWFARGWKGRADSDNPRACTHVASPASRQQAGSVLAIFHSVGARYRTHHILCLLHDVTGKIRPCSSAASPTRRGTSTTPTEINGPAAVTRDPMKRRRFRCSVSVSYGEGWALGLSISTDTLPLLQYLCVGRMPR